jgi:hypothetical protein
MTYEDRTERIIKIVKKHGHNKKAKLLIIEELRGIASDAVERGSFSVTNWDD